VAAFAQAGDQAAHLIAEGHIGSAVLGFSFVVFAVCWAWVNFSWFSSAFDTDDWCFRVLTMVQMVGVLIVALGTPPVFRSIDAGQPLDNGTVVAGYIVMRVAMLAQWLRVARQDPDNRGFAVVFSAAIAVSQLGWTAVPFLGLTLSQLAPILAVLYLIELAGPVIAARRGVPPWHAGHIAERYALLVMITLGEVILGTIAAVAAVVDRVGWNTEAVLVVIAGTGLAFSLWWTYFAVPFGQILHRHRSRAWVWGYGGIVIFASIAAMGAGIHAAAYVAGAEAKIPVGVTVIGYFAIYAWLVHAVDPFHLLLVAGTVAVLATAVLVAVLGGGLGPSLLTVMLASAVTVVGYESVGHRHMAAVLDRVQE
jgi:low temperature requirement protein LtrA